MAAPVVGLDVELDVPDQMSNERRKIINEMEVKDMINVSLNGNIPRPLLDIIGSYAKEGLYLISKDNNNKDYTEPSTFYVENLPKQTGDYESTFVDDNKNIANDWDDNRLNLTSAERRLFREKPMLDDQKRSIISLFNGENLVWHARTGCGKTTSIMWTLLHHAVSERQDNSHLYGVRSSCSICFFSSSHSFFHLLAASHRADRESRSGPSISAALPTIGAHFGETRRSAGILRQKVPRLPGTRRALHNT